MATKGGKRKGAGRPKGAQNRATLEKRAVAEAFNQRVMQKADALFHAQYSLAVGSAKVFRIDEEGTGKNKKRVHTLVTDEEEIKALLDEHEGGAGVVDDSFYYITTTPPDNRALDSLLNRALGKPTEHKTVEYIGVEAARAAMLAFLAEHPKARPEVVAPIYAETFGVSVEDLGEIG